MKILCMHLKLALCVTAAAILLGVVTVTPCADGEKCCLLGRKYGFDASRVSDIFGRIKSIIAKTKQ